MNQYVLNVSVRVGTKVKACICGYVCVSVCVVYVSFSLLSNRDKKKKTQHTLHILFQRLSFSSFHSHFVFSLSFSSSFAFGMKRERFPTDSVSKCLAAVERNREKYFLCSLKKKHREKTRRGSE